MGLAQVHLILAINVFPLFSSHTVVHHLARTDVMFAES